MSKRTIKTSIGTVAAETFADGSVYLTVNQKSGPSARIGLSAAEWASLTGAEPEIVPVATTDDEGKPTVIALPAEEWQALGRIAVEA